MLAYSMEPSYSSGNVPGLAGFAPENAIEYEFNGTNVAVAPDGTVYTQNSNGDYVADNDLSATVQQVNVQVPGAVQQATSNSGFNFNSVLDNLSKIVTTAVTGFEQQKLLNINIDRAKQGLPPLNASAYMPGINVGISPDTKKLVYIVAAGLGAVFLLGLRRG